MKDRNAIPRFRKGLRLAYVTALDDAADETLNAIDQGFDEGRDATGTPWQPLAPETIRRKGHSQILVDTGEFRDSFYSEVDRGRLRITLGTDSPLASWHEFGTEKMPARPVLQPAARYARRNVIKQTLTNAIELAAARFLLR